MSMNFFRNKRNSIFTVAIFGAIILTFIFWGVGNFQESGVNSGVLTRVNGEEVPYLEFQRILSRQLEMYGQVFGGGKKLNEQIVQLVERQVASGLVMRKLMAQKAQNLGIIIGKEEILRELEKIPAFQDPRLKRFSPKIYAEVLEANNLRPNLYESGLIEQLAGDRLRSLIEQSVRVSNAEIAENYSIQNAEFDLQVATFDPNSAQLKSKVKITEDQIKDHYQKHQGEYLSSEKRILEVATLNQDETPVTLTDQEVENYFKENIQNSTLPQWNETRARALHILISDTTAAGLQKIKNIQAKIKTQGGGETSFRTFAKRESEDPGSALKGGDLGYFNETAMVKPFSEAVFSPESRLRSLIGPVKSDFGYHLIWILDRTNPSPELSNRKDEIRYLLETEKVKSRWDAIREKVRSAMESKTSVAENLRALGFHLTTTSALEKTSRTESIPFQILQKAFRAPEKEWQGPEDFQQKLIVYRVNDIVEPSPLALAEAKDKIREKLESLDVEKKVRETPWEKLADAGARVVTHKDLKPYQNPKIPGFGESESLVRAVQELSPAKSVSSPLWIEGKWVILKGSDFNFPQVDRISDADRQKIHEEVLSKKRTLVVDAFMDNLVKNAKIPEDFRKKYNL